MRIRTWIATAALVLVAEACSSAAPETDQDVPAPATPMGAVDAAQNVADQLDQRQVVLEAELNNPFQQP